MPLAAVLQKDRRKDSQMIAKAKHICGEDEVLYRRRAALL